MVVLVTKEPAATAVFPATAVSQATVVLAATAEQPVELVTKEPAASAATAVFLAIADSPV